MSKSRRLAARLLYTALQILKEKGGECPSNELVAEVGRRVELDDWAKGRYEKSSYVRWESILHFFSIDCVKAGFLVKRKGIWFLTAEGEAALQLGEAGLLDAATSAYRKWKAERPKPEVIEEPGAKGPAEAEEESAITLDQIEQMAMETLKSHVASKNPYEFQDLAAALLRGMGYYTPFVAPRGKDAGVDIVAYRDPLGTVSPRIKVQVRHRETPASVQDIRQLMGVRQKDGDVGIFISTSGFTTDAKTAARESHVHVELVDLNRFIQLWQDFYQRLTDEDKQLLPLHPVHFLAPTE